MFSRESSYNARSHDPTASVPVVNPILTFFYRAHNRIQYGQTADVGYLEYQGVVLNVDNDNDDKDGLNKKLPWRFLLTKDHVGRQTWAQGNVGGSGSGATWW